MNLSKTSDLPRLLLRAGVFSHSRYGISQRVNAPATLGALLSPNGSGAVVSCCQPLPFLLGGVRFRYTKKWSNKEAKRDPEGIQYHGFTYFPRFPGQEDPPVEPSKLFAVRRIRSLYGCPYWEKKWIFALKLEKPNTVAIVKNTPENNKRLYRVKHLVEILPIKTPYGMPDSPENGFLKQNGDFVSYNVLGAHGDVNLENGEKMIENYNIDHFDPKDLSKRLHKRWFSRYDTV